MSHHRVLDSNRSARFVLTMAVPVHLVCSLALSADPVFAADPEPAATPADAAVSLPQLNIEDGDMVSGDADLLTPDQAADRTGTEAGGWLREQLRLFRGYPRRDKAYRLMSQGRPDEARAELEAAISRNPQDTEARIALLQVRRRLGDHHRVVRDAGELLAEDAGRHYVRLLRGLSQAQLGQVMEVYQDCRAVAEAPDVSQELRLNALKCVVETALHQQDDVIALGALQELERIEPGLPITFNRSLVLRRLQRFEDAAIAFEDALAIAESDSDRARILVNIGYNELERGDLEAARLAFEQAQEIEASDAPLKRALADVWHRLENDSAAERLVREALAIRPSAEDRMFLADLLAGSGRRDEALEQLAKLEPQTLQPEQRRHVLLSRGFILHESGRFDEAVEAFRAAADVRPDAAALQALAQSLEAAGRPAESAQILATALQIEPHPELHLRLGVLLSRDGNDEAALEHLDAAVEDSRLSEEQRFEAQATRGYLLRRLGRETDAAEAFGAAVRLRPDPRIMLDRAQALQAGGRPAEAIAVLEQVRARQPSYAVDLQLGTLYAERGARRQAIESLRRAVASAPNAELSAEHARQLGFLLAEQERFAEAQKAFEQALARAPGAADSVLLVGLGVVATAAGDYGRAVEVLRRVPDIENFPDALRSLAYAEFRQGRHRNAVSLYRRYLELDGLSNAQRSEAQLSLGFAYTELGAVAEALAAFRAALPHVANEAAVRLSIANLLARAGRWPEARVEYERCAALQPTPAALLGAGTAHMQLAEPAAAIPYFRQALEQPDGLTPETRHQALAQLGEAYLQTGDSRQAVVVLEQARRESPDEVPLLYALAYAYKELDREDDSAAAFTRALASDGDNPVPAIELGYMALRDARNQDAARYFRAAIDKLRQNPDSGTTDRDDGHERLAHLQREVRRLEKAWDVTLFQSYASDSRAVSVSPDGTIGGIIPSQGGLQLTYRPPVIGLRNERVFEVFGRALWANRLDSIEPDGDTMQVGLGFRYKPLRTQNLFVGTERLFGVGDETQDDWLIRATYGWGLGLEPTEAQKRHWNYTYTYWDLGYFFEDPGTTAFYGEIRQGRTFRVRDDWLVTPHVVIDGRVQDPDAQDISYLEGGVGVSFVYDPSLDCRIDCKTYTPKAELRVQYKHELINFGSGFLVTAVLNF